MRLPSFTFMVTDRCNFNCTYCYQTKGERDADLSIIKKAVDFFSPFFDENCLISFYGGEPLLAFGLIKDTVHYLEKKGLKKDVCYAVSSNGCLINDEKLEFFNNRKFSLLLSFDGFAQEIGRKRGSFNQILSVLKEVLTCPGIELETNSVFTPETVKYLAESIGLIIGLGVQNVSLTLSHLLPWDRCAIGQLEKELETLKKIIKPIYKKTGSMPLINFRKRNQQGVFGCSAGKTGMTLAPDGKLWGCYLFGDYYKGKEETEEYWKYCFGDLDSFMKDHRKIYPEILANYSDLRLDYFSTRDTLCLFCADLEVCQVCPINAALSGADIGEIPGWTCQITKIIRKEKKDFWQEVEGINVSSV